MSRSAEAGRFVKGAVVLGMTAAVAACGERPQTVEVGGVTLMSCDGLKNLSIASDVKLPMGQVAETGDYKVKAVPGGVNIRENHWYNIGLGGSGVDMRAPVDAEGANPTVTNESSAEGMPYFLKNNTKLGAVLMKITRVSPDTVDLKFSCGVKRLT